MHLDYSAAQVALREDVRRYIAGELSPQLQDKIRRGQFPDKAEVVAWQRGLHRNGWAAPHWPREYGGLALGPAEKLIIQEELFRACAPMPLVFNVDMLGPVLLKFGTPEQKANLLPILANADIWFCQGFSEPEAGSDLASLRTSARLEGDTYIVNGQKIWTTHAHHADWIFALVKTAPGAKPQQSISFLMIDLKSPGVTVRPIETIDGQHHLNEVFFDEVSVPASQRVGAEGEGWDCAKYLLSNERTGIARVGYCRERLLYARGLLAERAAQGVEDEDFLLEIVALEAQLRGLELMNWRFIESKAATLATPGHASMLKLKGVELQQTIATLLMRMATHAGLEKPPVKGWSEAKGDSAMTMRYFYSRSASIYGGTTEVQKNILAKTILG